MISTVRPLWRSLYRRWTRFLLLWRYRLFQRHRHNRLVLEQVAGMPLVVLPSVMNPALFLTGEFFGKQLNDTLIPRGARVLDMGTGSGIGALCAARWAREVVALDINPEAVRCARINAMLNRAEERITVLQSDLFEAVRDEGFDVILFNPPYYRGAPEVGFDQALRATTVVERFARELPGHLTTDGYALVLLSSDGDEGGFLREFATLKLIVAVVAREELGNEVLSIYRLSPQHGDAVKVSQQAASRPAMAARAEH